MSRPEISFPVNSAARVAHRPTKKNCKQLIRICKYLATTADLGLLFVKQASNDPIVPIGMVDASHAPPYGTFNDNYRGQEGIAFWVGTIGLISWRSGKAPLLATSSTEDEFLALMNACKEAAHLKNLLTQVFGYIINQPVLIREDNESCIRMALNPCDQVKSKHYDLRSHYIRQQVGRHQVLISHIRTNLMTSDIFTKNLPRVPFERHRASLGVSSHLSNPSNFIQAKNKDSPYKGVDFF